MKFKIVYSILVTVALFGCSSEKVGDCFQTTGKVIQKEFTVEDFNEIEIGEGVTLYLTQGTENKVSVETGGHLMNDIEVSVENGKLILKDNNSCNFVRKYDVTKMYVTAVNVNRIYNNSQFNVYSTGKIVCDSLELISENYNYESVAVGSFYMEIEAVDLQVTFNQWSTATITGAVTNLTVNFYSGDSRFEGENLIAGHVSVYHRSSNDIIVHPVESLTGQIVSTGNVIAVNRPPVVSVETPYTGTLIFRD